MMFSKKNPLEKAIKSDSIFRHFYCRCISALRPLPPSFDARQRASSTSNFSASNGTILAQSHVHAISVVRETLIHANVCLPSSPQILLVKLYFYSRKVETKRSYDRYPLQSQWASKRDPFYSTRHLPTPKLHKTGGGHIRGREREEASERAR